MSYIFEALAKEIYDLLVMQINFSKAPFCKNNSSKNINGVMNSISQENEYGIYGDADRKVSHLWHFNFVPFRSTDNQETGMSRKKEIASSSVRATRLGSIGASQ